MRKYVLRELFWAAVTITPFAIYALTGGDNIFVAYAMGVVMSIVCGGFVIRDAHMAATKEQDNAEVTG
jgi:hypothetical protein